MLVQRTDGTVVSEDWPERLEGIRAIECREYHLRCWECRFSRWFGQSMEDAQLAATKHQISKRHTKQSVDYLRHPDTYKEFRLRYPNQRRVKPFIVGNINRLKAKVHTIQTATQSVLSEDKPPF